ncbi:MAG: hypothetical protein HWD86_11680 [Kangiellaceae bacterium]|nr:hypothetical protein [Kangiellaceae bacterium]
MKKYTIWIYALCLVVASILAASKALDDYGYQYTDEALKRSLVAFGIARGLNGLISVAQEAEIAMSPAGVGLTVSPGEILDPVNDLIERFSVVMLVSAAAIGVQKLLLSMSAWQFFNVFVIIAWLGLAGYLLYQLKNKTTINPWLCKVALFLLLVRFATPIMALTSQGVYALFLESEYQQASQGLEKVTQDIENQTPQNNPTQTNDDSVFGQAKQWLNKTASQLDLKKQIDSYKQSAERASKNVIDLITVFIVQTLLFPLFFLWVLIKSGAGLLKRSPII